MSLRYKFLTFTAIILSGHLFGFAQTIERRAAPPPIPRAGDATSERLVGLAYLKGNGVPQDPEQAAIWLRKAADKGDAVGQVELGLLYMQGQGLPKDEGLAASWFRKAADQGNAMGQNMLGMFYEYGMGVPKNEALALSWLQKAVDQGEEHAEFNLGQKYENASPFAQDGEIRQDLVKASFLYSKAARQGLALAQFSLGSMLHEGKGGIQNYTESYFWLSLAAVGLKDHDDQRHAIAERDVVGAMLTADQRTRTQERAEKWLAVHPK